MTNGYTPLLSMIVQTTEQVKKKNLINKWYSQDVDWKIIFGWNYIYKKKTLTVGKSWFKDIASYKQN